MVWCDDVGFCSVAVGFSLCVGCGVMMGFCSSSVVGFPFSFGRGKRLESPITWEGGGGWVGIA